MTHYRGATSLGCTVGGVGQAILEETVTDAVTGRIPNGTFGDYPSRQRRRARDRRRLRRLTPIGTKGIGEIGLPGIARDYDRPPDR